MHLKGRCQFSTKNELTGTPDSVWSFYTPSSSTLFLSAVISTLLLWTSVGNALKQNICDVLGISDIWRCSCRLHQGRVGPAGHVPAKAVQRCDAGKYTSSGLPGWVFQCVYVYKWVNRKVVSREVSGTASAYLHTHSTLYPETFIDLTWKIKLFLYIVLYLVCHSTRI